jgi:hypothetical protein
MDSDDPSSPEAGAGDMTQGLIIALIVITLLLGIFVAVFASKFGG